MKKILLPIDGSDRCMKSVDLVRTLYDPKEVEIAIVTVKEDYESFIRTEFEPKKVTEENMPLLDKVEKQLEGYKVFDKAVLVGKSAGEESLDYANLNKIHAIIMTKSSKAGHQTILGSVTAHVVKNARCVVIITPER